jgi:hypothetical protein
MRDASFAPVAVPFCPAPISKTESVTAPIMAKNIWNRFIS